MQSASSNLQKRSLLGFFTHPGTLDEYLQLIKHSIENREPCTILYLEHRKDSITRAHMSPRFFQFSPSSGRIFPKLEGWTTPPPGPAKTRLSVSAS